MTSDQTANVDTMEGEDGCSSSGNIQIVEECVDEGCADSRQSKNNDQYESRKPKWWTQLAGRRGTKAQRQAIHRMTGQGYCISKDVLTDFSRVDNRSKQTATSEDRALVDEWKRGWWNRTLAVNNPADTSTVSAFDISIMMDYQNKKYAQKFQEMIGFKNPLPSLKYKQKWLEIGFGSGDNLLANARNNPDILHMGSEIHQPGVGSLAQKIEDSLKTNNAGNIRILPGDGIKLLYHLPNNYLDAILITFPDPWPKEFHNKWRVVQTETVREMKRVLLAEGRVFVATDAVCFNDWTRDVFSKENDNWMEVVPCPARMEWLSIVSYYEQKGINEGRNAMLQCWRSHRDSNNHEPKINI